MASVAQVFFSWVMLHTSTSSAELTSSNILMVFGAMGLIFYTYPWLGIAFVPLGGVLVSESLIVAGLSCSAALTDFRQYLTAIYYRQTSRELKRIDSVLRSPIYASFSEQVPVHLSRRQAGADVVL